MPEIKFSGIFCAPIYLLHEYKSFDCAKPSKMIDLIKINILCIDSN